MTKLLLTFLIGLITTTRLTNGQSCNVNQDGQNKTYNVCLSSACVLSAALLIENMDTTQDPCQDFYQFACGGYLQKTVIPEDKTSMSLFTEIDTILKLKLKSLLEAEIVDSDLPPIVDTKNLYQTCVNIKNLDSLGVHPMKDVLKDLGGWPVLEGASWNDGKKLTWSLIDAMASSIERGFSLDYVIAVGVLPDRRNNTANVLEVDQPSLGMPDRAYLLKGTDDPLVKAYYKLMVDIAVYLGADRKTAEKDLTDVLKFEIQLANISLAREDRQNSTAMYNKMTVKQLSELSKTFDFKKFFNSFLLTEIGDDEPVVVDAPKFIEKVGELIVATPNRTLANYLMWRIVQATSIYLDSELRRINFEFNKVLTGQAQEEERWLTCVNVVTANMGVSAGSLYVRKVFDTSAKQTAQEIMDYLQNAFDKILEKNDWMDNTTRTKALAKAAAMRRFIAFPDQLLNDTLLDDTFKTLLTTNTTYYDNILNTQQFNNLINLARLGQPVDKNSWYNHGQAAVVNAFYNPSENSIIFPAGILQGLLFNNKRPNYLNFGAIGFVIGHEQTHAFDNSGREYDSDGNLVDWWKPETAKKFEKLSECIVDQFSNYTVPEVQMKVNGKATLGENIADLGGLKTTLEAYKTWIKDHGEEARLPGMNYTSQQLFWISAANVWCEKARPETLVSQILTDVHSPSRFRVNGPFQDLAQFSQDFSCPAGSPMNPLKKCSIW